MSRLLIRNNLDENLNIKNRKQICILFSMTLQYLIKFSFKNFRAFIFFQNFFDGILNENKFNL